MKNLIIASGIIITFGLNSCKKKYTCECTIVSISQIEDGSFQSTGTTSISGNVKNEEDCKASGIDSAEFGTTSSKCELK